MCMCTYTRWLDDKCKWVEMLVCWVVMYGIHVHVLLVRISNVLVQWCDYNVLSRGRKIANKIYLNQHGFAERIPFWRPTTWFKVGMKSRRSSTMVSFIQNVSFQYCQEWLLGNYYWNQQLSEMFDVVINYSVHTPKAECIKVYTVG